MDFFEGQLCKGRGVSLSSTLVLTWGVRQHDEKKSESYSARTEPGPLRSRHEEAVPCVWIYGKGTVLFLVW